MSALSDYLQRYYLDAAGFAAACSISTGQLEQLLREGLVPAPSYEVSGDGRLLSPAFGEFDASGCAPGRYFHPGNAVWVALALEVRNRLGPERARAELEQRFQDNFRAALAELDRDLLRLPDAFADDGSVLAAGLDARARGAWEAFERGIYGLCVADPASEQSIARKEVLQEALARVDEEGEAALAAHGGRQRVLELVEHYARAAMPFSPPEYPRSSRKRLVEDLRERLRRPSDAAQRLSDAHPVARWHGVVATRDRAALEALVAEDVVFLSPVVHTPQRGKAITLAYLSAALEVFGTPGFRYVRELLGERDAMLEFETTIEGIEVNGVDLLRWNADGRIVEFKVMLRPLKAVNLVHQRMAALLGRG
jgi:hypothetical protein